MIQAFFNLHFPSHLKTIRDILLHASLELLLHSYSSYLVFFPINLQKSSSLILFTVLYAFLNNCVCTEGFNYKIWTRRPQMCILIPGNYKSSPLQQLKQLTAAYIPHTKLNSRTVPVNLNHSFPSQWVASPLHTLLQLLFHVLNNSLSITCLHGCCHQTSYQ